MRSLYVELVWEAIVESEGLILVVRLSEVDEVKLCQSRVDLSAEISLMLALSCFFDDQCVFICRSSSETHGLCDKGGRSGGYHLHFLDDAWSPHHGTIM